VEPPETPGTIAQTPEDAARISAAASGPIAIPGFEIEHELGRGGMGVVFKSKQVGLNRTVALKVVLAGPFADPTTRARFLLEAEAVAAVDHPHVVKVFAFGEHAGFPYLVMEYLPGGTLADSLKANGPLPARAAAEMLRKLADAVSHAHDRGVIHRDIKPLNVLLTPTGEPRLTDFGLAKVGRAEHNLSISGQVLGTPAYMSPEQAAGKVREIGPATDIYALGAVLYDLLTGRPPFVGESVAVTLVQVLTAEPERPRALKSDVPPELEAVCLQCLEKDRTKRYTTASDLIADLDRYLAGEAVVAVSPETPELALNPIPVSMPSASPTDASVDATEVENSQSVRVRPVHVFRRRLLWLTVALGFGILCAMVSAGVIKYQARSAVLVVESDGPEVASRYRGGRLLLYGLDGQMRYVISAAETAIIVEAGQYKVRLEGAEGLAPEPSELVVKRNDTLKVRITLLQKKVVQKVDGPPLGDIRLFMPGKLGRWQGDGGEWDIVKDSEGNGALTGYGGSVRPFDFAVPARFRVAIALDAADATAVDLVIATSTSPSKTRWLIRADKAVKGSGTVRFGKQTGTEPFEPEGAAVPLPAELGRKSQYLEFGYDRADGWLTARFGGTVLGRVRDADLQTTELRLHATGTVRINEAFLTDLRPKN
jgi:hypothetical protein